MHPSLINLGKSYAGVKEDWRLALKLETYKAQYGFYIDCRLNMCI